ncbi:MAG: hypothetical protein GVY08_09770 [Bacteroidetes bacterium]|jgi:photosystem II stability/assembly factor-like uncharacterized protein|nr:hypothetical protein [Bacteroidota bacterium]
MTTKSINFFKISKLNLPQIVFAWKRFFTLFFIFLLIASCSDLRTNSDQANTVTDFPWPREAYYGVWGSSPNNVFVVGTNGTILNYDGIEWIEMESGITHEISSVWGSASDNVYVVAEGGTILHYNGSDWTPMENPFSNAGLYGVWGTSSGDVYAAGVDGTILRYDGEIWQQLDFVPNENLFDVWVSDRDDMYITGGFGTILVDIHKNELYN